MYILVSTHAKKKQDVFVFQREMTTRASAATAECDFLVKMNPMSRPTCSFSRLLPADYNRRPKELE